MEFYSSIKKNEILSLAGKWIELENIILSEVNQVQRTKTTCFLSCVDYKPNKYKLVYLVTFHTKERSLKEEEG
jgi:hypothetical protein